MCVHARNNCCSWRYATYKRCVSHLITNEAMSAGWMKWQWGRLILNCPLDTTPKVQILYKAAHTMQETKHYYLCSHVNGPCVVLLSALHVKVSVLITQGCRILCRLQKKRLWITVRRSSHEIQWNMRWSEWAEEGQWNEAVQRGAECLRWTRAHEMEKN